MFTWEELQHELDVLHATWPAAKVRLGWDDHGRCWLRVEKALGKKATATG